MAGSGSDFNVFCLSPPLCTSFAFIPNMFETDKDNQSEKCLIDTLIGRYCHMSSQMDTQKPLLFCSISWIL